MRRRGPRSRPMLAAPLARATAVLPVALGACFSPRVEQPEKRWYVLEAAPPSPAGARVGATVAVGRVRPTPRTSGQRFVYRTGEHSYEADFYHEFLTAPSAQVGDVLRRAVEGSGLFAGVVDAGSPVESDWTIEGVLDEIHGDLRGERWRAVLELELYLLDESRAQPAVRLHRRYRREVEVPEPSAAALAEGWSRALGEALAAWLGEVEADLAAPARAAEAR